VTTRNAPCFGVEADADETVAASAAVVQALGLSQAAWCEQVHGATVVPVARAGHAGRFDGLTTSAIGLALVGRSADCPLVIAAAPVDGHHGEDGDWAVGMAHASWRATVQGITRELVGVLSAHHGVKPALITAGICPAAGPCCYEVGEEVRQALRNRQGASATRFFEQRNGKLFLDLWRANTDQLLSSGLRTENIHVAGLCTICRADLFPSYRVERQGAARFAAVIGLRIRMAVR
jgi:YfiH family protein